MLTPEQIALLAVIVLLVLGVIAMIASRSARTRRVSLRRRFGPEYDRAIEQYGSAAKAERVLLDRAKRVGGIRLQPLSEADRSRFAASWRSVQARFVDDPAGAVRDANELIKNVMQAHGYPMENFEQRVADLSVDHANVVHHYRSARVLAEANREGRANTEELRQAFVHFRVLFTDLLEEPVDGRGLREARV
jgi:hypothetical protein